MHSLCPAPKEGEVKLVDHPAPFVPCQDFLLVVFFLLRCCFSVAQCRLIKTCIYFSILFLPPPPHLSVITSLRNKVSEKRLLEATQQLFPQLSIWDLSPTASVFASPLCVVGSSQLWARIPTAQLCSVRCWVRISRSPRRWQHGPAANSAFVPSSGSR